VKVIAVGKVKERYLQDGCAEYLKRLSAYARVEVVELKEEANGSTTYRVEEEARRIEQAVPARSHVVVLDERGKQQSSEEMAEYLASVTNSGQSTVCFIIGGADGVAPRLRANANLLLSFSRFTFPHQLFRMMLLEQIYRAFTIQRGEPYHRLGLP
jgi:23S rRNA (pseudouridine1915-N3)-methyltransferase